MVSLLEFFKEFFISGWVPENELRNFGSTGIPVLGWAPKSELLGIFGAGT